MNGDLVTIPSFLNDFRIKTTETNGTQSRHDQKMTRPSRESKKRQSN